MYFHACLILFGSCFTNSNRVLKPNNVTNRVRNVEKKANSTPIPVSEIQNNRCHVNRNMMYSVIVRESVNGGLDYWTGLLDWTTGLSAYYEHAQ